MLHCPALLLQILLLWAGRSVNRYLFLKSWSVVGLFKVSRYSLVIKVQIRRNVLPLFFFADVNCYLSANSTRILLLSVQGYEINLRGHLKLSLTKAKTPGRPLLQNSELCVPSLILNSCGIFKSRIKICNNEFPLYRKSSSPMSI